MTRPGLYANIAAKKARIAAGSGERMKKKGKLSFFRASLSLSVSPSLLCLSLPPPQ